MDAIRRASFGSTAVTVLMLGGCYAQSKGDAGTPQMQGATSPQPSGAAHVAGGLGHDAGAPATTNDAHAPAAGDKPSTPATATTPLDCSNVHCPVCAPGDRPVMTPGQCCPTDCIKGDGGHVGVTSDAGPSLDIDAGVCADVATPGCSSNQWPYCAPDWQTAMSFYMGCPNPFSDASLAKCGGVNTILVLGPYVTDRYFYDGWGRLEGFESIASDGHARCEAYIQGFKPPAGDCQPIKTDCPDAGGATALPDLTALDAGTFVTWQGSPPDCTTGQAAYDAYQADQLARFDGCTNDNMCLPAPITQGPTNRCKQTCDLLFTTVAINDQILSRLDQFGNVACARCQDGPQPSCPLTNISSPPKCVSGVCTASPPPH